MSKILKEYQSPLRVIHHCGRISYDDDKGCPFSVGGHGLFCGHPTVSELRGKAGIPEIPYVSFYGKIPRWCPLKDHDNPYGCDGEYGSCKRCNEKYSCGWSLI